jgi:glutamine synthetase
MWLSRFLLHRVAEQFHTGVTFHPKFIPGDWNGSGAHCNCSTNSTRADGGRQVIEDYIMKLKERHSIHVEFYGQDNEQRLTGKHETASIHQFLYGVADRGASVRIPRACDRDGKGYYEDRRPASNCDPYIVTGLIADTTLLNGQHSQELVDHARAWKNEYFTR